jgi:hypothetical protein
MPDKSTTLALIRGRAQTIKDACREKKLDPDTITAAAMLYNAMKIMGLPADTILDGPITVAMQSLLASIEAKGRTLDKFNASDPDGLITLTNAELLTLMHAKLGDA